MIYDSLFKRSLYANGTPNTNFQFPTDNPGAAFVHDLFLTKNYVIVVEGSLRQDVKTRLIKGQSVTYFDETKNLRFGVLPRKNPSPDNVIWVASDAPGWVWHTISAWENDDGVGESYYTVFHI